MKTIFKAIYTIFVGLGIFSLFALAIALFMVLILWIGNTFPIAQLIIMYGLPIVALVGIAGLIFYGIGMAYLIDREEAKKRINEYNNKE